MDRKVTKTDAEWRAELDPVAYSATLKPMKDDDRSGER
jgi:hypothetical protein